MTKLAGVFPVLPTPFTASGAVDEPAFLRLADWALSCGVDGVVFPGMASEVETLSPEDRQFGVARVLELVAARRAQSAGELIAALRSATADFARGAEQLDDLTAGVLKVHGAAAGAGRRRGGGAAPPRAPVQRAHDWRRRSVSPLAGEDPIGQP